MRKIEESREAYKPNEINYILIAESPPNDSKRFFYYPDVKEHDYLFLAVMKALYPEMHNSYLLSGRATHIKVDLLRRFRSDGFYLLDLFESASAMNEVPVSQAVNTMIELLKRIATLKTPIILIKSSIYDILARPLAKSGFTNLVRERIPFPLYQWKSVFHTRFLQALAKAGYNLRESTA
jgi:hypothetical protein